ncbi:MAG TPA: hypothetical protein VK957_17330 [Lunatimonas sp.]|nr:hypothetical protein [Lunatimonas sp.]
MYIKFKNSSQGIAVLTVGPSSYWKQALKYREALQGSESLSRSGRETEHQVK